MRRNTSGRVWSITGCSSGFGAEPNVPVRGAAAILKTLDVARPPLRLVLGVDAVDGMRERHQALLAEVAAWTETSRSTVVSGALQAGV